MDLNIVFEDKHIIVVVKPPKVPSQSDKTDDIDMLTMVKEHLLNKSNKNNDPYVGLIHRLDRPVGGLMVFTKTKEANSKLSEEIRTRRFKKEYLAVVCGQPEMDHEELKDFLIKLRTVNMSKVASEGTKNAKESILEYECLHTTPSDEFGMLSLLNVKLKTGRHHQIRVQLSNAHLPLWGDNKYNKQFVKMKTWTQISLWASKVSFRHPFKKTICEFESKPNEEFPFTLFDI
ncbi:RNA pseudouridine synthase [Lutibacter sp. B2]|nr:RNA pseudouridine synthase [Lutibacter sp. B2]